jgi:hypothetical protein
MFAAARNELTEGSSHREKNDLTLNQTHLGMAPVNATWFTGDEDGDKMKSEIPKKCLWRVLHSLRIRAPFTNKIKLSAELRRTHAQDKK